MALEYTLDTHGWHDLLFGYYLEMLVLLRLPLKYTWYVRSTASTIHYEYTWQTAVVAAY